MPDDERAAPLPSSAEHNRSNQTWSQKLPMRAPRFGVSGGGGTGLSATSCLGTIAGSM